MRNPILAHAWVQRANDAGVMLFARDGDVWVGSVLRGQPAHRVERFREALNADPDGKAALLAHLSPTFGEIS